MNIDQIIVWAQANQTTVLAAAFIALLGYAIYKKTDDRAFGSWDGKDWSERVIPDLIYATKRDGMTVNKPIVKGEQPLGWCKNKRVMNVTQEDLEGYITREVDDSQDKKAIKEMLDEDEQQHQVIAYLLTPPKEGMLPLKYYAWMFKEYLMNDFDKGEVRVVIQEAELEHNAERVKLHEDVEFRYIGSKVFIQNDVRAISRIKSINWRQANLKLENSLPDFLEKISELDPKHAQSMGELKQAQEGDKRNSMRDFADS